MSKFTEPWQCAAAALLVTGLLACSGGPRYAMTQQSQQDAVQWEPPTHSDQQINAWRQQFLQDRKAVLADPGGFFAGEAIPCQLSPEFLHRHFSLGMSQKRVFFELLQGQCDQGVPVGPVRYRVRSRATQAQADNAKGRAASAG